MLILILIFLHLNYNIVHSKYKMSYKDVFSLIWAEINTFDSKTQMEIKKRLNEQISETISTCFTGKISRLINCLCGFSQCVMIYISDSEQIYNIISIAKLKFTDLNDVKSYVKQELIERNYNIDIIDEWISFID